LKTGEKSFRLASFQQGIATRGNGFGHVGKKKKRGKVCDAFRKEKKGNYIHRPASEPRRRTNDFRFGGKRGGTQGRGIISSSDANLTRGRDGLTAISVGRKGKEKCVRVAGDRGGGHAIIHRGEKDED